MIACIDAAFFSIIIEFSQQPSEAAEGRRIPSYKRGRHHSPLESLYRQRARRRSRLGAKPNRLGLVPEINGGGRRGVDVPDLIWNQTPPRPQHDASFFTLHSVGLRTERDFNFNGVGKRSFKFQLVYGEMKKGVLFSTTFLFCCLLLLLLLDSSVSLPLCVDSTAPFTLNKTLGFCPYNGSTCCNSTQDAQIQKQFQAMKISDPACASILKSILCATCDPFSAELFTVKSSPRSVPVLCNSTIPANSSQLKVASMEDFCSQVWDTCKTVSITNSPFAPSLQGQAGGAQVKANATKLTDLWQSKTDFCSSFGGASDNTSVCFEGEPVALNKTATPINPPIGLCLEKIGNGSYLSMAAHPDGSNRAFFSSQMGKVWLATLPDKESGGTLKLDESSPFVDLTDQVYFDTQFGMMGMAFHPNFAQNGRFFASFNCDKSKWSGCNGRCSCNSDVNCDPSKIGTDHGAQPCQYQTVIAEYTANGTGSQPSSVNADLYT
ncbi:hipl1 protein [Stylosanthes scabra]|uniref:Hipl1 protein n=1 Tax=Stylosanthes scabra TaxID=79078 RepID=A0ABU6TUP8_9FABA|nr:hipl1 protein [Stylosanthes scabra]